MKYFQGLVLVLFSFASTANAQLFDSSFPLATTSADVITTSLANSNVATSGKLAHTHINPAGIGVDNTLQFSGRYRHFGLDAHMLSAYLSAQTGRSAFAFSLRRLEAGATYAMSFGQPQYIEAGMDKELYLNGAYAHTFQNGIKAGIAGNVYHSSPHFYPFLRYYKQDDYYHYSFDLGLQYEIPEFESGEIIFIPSFGISLTDFGPAKRYRSKYPKDHMPTTLRAGTALSVETKAQIQNQAAVKVNLMAGASKFMVRREMGINADGDTARVPVGAFKSLFQSWDSYRWSNRYSWNRDKVSLAQQIWLQAGINVTFLETLSIRLGYERAGKKEDFLNKFVFGFGIDLYYLSIDFAQLKYVNSYRAEVYSYEIAKHLQFTSRIPLDGQRPDTILNHIFNWRER